MRPTLCRAAMLFFHPDDIHLRRPVEMFSLWWDRNLPDLCYQSNDTAFLVLSTNIVSVDDDFLTKLKSCYSSCSYLCDEITRWKGHGMIKSSYGLYSYHDRLVIPRPAQDLRFSWLNEYHDNAGGPLWRRFLVTLSKRVWGDECLLIAKLIVLIVLCVIELSEVAKVLHHYCLLWVCLITLGKLLAWILSRTYPKASNSISLPF